MAIHALFRRLFGNEFGRRALLGLLVLVLLLGGIRLRQWTWDKTRHVRFQHDLVNALYWGSETLAEARRLSPNEASVNSWSSFLRGYLALYDRVKREAYEDDYQLDYPPLRLLVMSIWAKQVRSEFPEVSDEHPKHLRPLLDANLFCELLSAVAIFLVVRLWVRRTLGTAGSDFLRRIPTEHRAWICGLAAASVAWFEPSTILDAHGWPQWDVWILPFYLFAVFAALKNRWFLCGCLLAAGAMFKGQLLFVAPFFVLWPMWQKRWTRALLVLAGFTATVALIVSPWLLRTPVAWIAAGIIGAGGSLIVLRNGWRHAWPWFAGILGLTIFLVGTIAGGSFGWLQIGFLYGSEHYPYLFISSCYNLPALLGSLGWSLKDSLWSYDFGMRYIAMTPQWTLRVLYLGALALCALGAARHMRTRDPRMLIAIAAPWLLMFALLGQMHERYLMWGAVVSAVALGVSVRLSVLHFIVSILSAAMIANVMLIDKKLDSTLRVIDVLRDARPYASGLVLACVAYYLWEVLSTRAPVIPRHRRELTEPTALSLGSAAREA